jgi:polyferredoxin
MAQAAKRRGTTARRIRTAVQIGFFVLVALIAAAHALEEAGIQLPIIAGASLHAVCPFGGVVSIYQVATAGTFVQKIHESSFVLMAIAFGIAVLVGPAFCGWACPLGSFQEWIGKIGRRIFGKRYNNMIPKKLDRWLRYLRYLVLAWVVYLTAVTGVLVFADYDPYFTLFNFYSEDVALAGLLILGAVMVLSLFVERPFCKYACPYGAVLGTFNLFRVFGIRRNAPTCINCKACDRECPMNIEVSTGGVVRDHQCISCMKCTSEAACPVAATVEMRIGAFKQIQEAKA